MDLQSLQTWIQYQGGPRFLHILLIILLAWIGKLFLNFLIREVEELMEDDDRAATSEYEQRAHTLGQMLRSAGVVFIVLIASTMILQEVGLNVGPIIAGAGIVGVAVGFGGQTLVKDAIAGFFILLENQFRVGDSISVKGTSGTVEKMTLRATFVRDINGTLHIIPNGEIRTLANQTKDWSRAVVNLNVSYDADVDQVLSVLEDVARHLMSDDTFCPMLLEEPRALGPIEFGDSGITMRVLAKTSVGKQWVVGRELRRRIKKAFAGAGIEMPYPRYDVYVRQGDSQT